MSRRPYYPGGLGMIEATTVAGWRSELERRLKFVEAWNNKEWESWLWPGAMKEDLPWNPLWRFSGTVGQGTESPIVLIDMIDEQDKVHPILSVKVWGTDDAFVVLNAILVMTYGAGDWSWCNLPGLKPLADALRAEEKKAYEAHLRSQGVAG